MYGCILEKKVCHAHYFLSSEWGGGGGAGRRRGNSLKGNVCL